MEGILDEKSGMDILWEIEMNILTEKERPMPLVTSQCLCVCGVEM